MLFLVLGSYYSYLYLKSIYFFSRVYSKGRLLLQGFRARGLGFGVVGLFRRRFLARFTACLRSFRGIRAH